jgi:hypothetical protein
MKGDRCVNAAAVVQTRFVRTIHAQVNRQLQLYSQAFITTARTYIRPTIKPEKFSHPKYALLDGFRRNSEQDFLSKLGYRIIANDPNLHLADPFGSISFPGLAMPFWRPMPRRSIWCILRTAPDAEQH